MIFLTLLKGGKLKNRQTKHLSQGDRGGGEGGGGREEERIGEGGGGRPNETKRPSQTKKTNQNKNNQTTTTAKATLHHCLFCVDQLFLSMGPVLEYG